MKWIALKTQQPPNWYEVLVSDGNYIHEAVRTQHGWSGPETQTGWETEFYLHPEPLYWAHKPKAPKVRPEDIPDPVIPKKRKYMRPPKKGTPARLWHDQLKKLSGDALLLKIMSRPSPWMALIEPQKWPKPFSKL
jgi:hypothetical protein